MRFVSPRVHGVLDYLFGVLFLFAPFWFNFASQVAKVSSMVFGAALLLISLLTRYPLGLVRVVPFPVHGGVELVAALALIALPWIGGFEAAMTSRNFFVATGIVLFALWATTDYKAAEETRPSTFGRGAAARG